MNSRHLSVLGLVLATVGLVMILITGSVSAQPTGSINLTASNGSSLYTQYLVGGTRLEVSSSASLMISTARGDIRIDYRTGKVELSGELKEDEAVVAFWRKTSEAFPEFKRLVLEEIIKDLAREKEQKP